MPKYSVTVYETRTYVIGLEAKDADEARVNAVLMLDAGGEVEPDSIEIEPENCWVEQSAEQ